MSNYNRIVKVLSRIVAKLQKLEAKHLAEIGSRYNAINDHQSAITELSTEATRAKNTAKKLADLIG